MILCDTNVISELIGPQPLPNVETWIDARNIEQLFVPTVSIAEIDYGLSIMPSGRRRRELQDRFEKFLVAVFGRRVLSFDEAAARVYGPIRAHRKEMGRPMSTFDGQIAAIARVNHLALATRNTKDFEDCGLELINPFTDTP